MKTKQLAMDAMLSAMCAVLGYLSLDMGSMKLSFESFPILLGAAMFGPVDGMLIGGIGTLIYQLLRYGVTVTTPLWILPYVVFGLVVGLYAKKWDYSPTPRQTLALVVLAQLLITVLNTGVLCVDGLIFGYFTPVFIYGALGLRLLVCLAKSLVFALILPKISSALRPMVK